MSETVEMMCRNCRSYTEDGECLMILDGDRTMPENGWCPLIDAIGDTQHKVYVPEGDD